jgi:hypothetical protein
MPVARRKACVVCRFAGSRSTARDALRVGNRERNREHHADFAKETHNAIIAILGGLTRRTSSTSVLNWNPLDPVYDNHFDLLLARLQFQS